MSALQCVDLSTSSMISHLGTEAEVLMMWKKGNIAAELLRNLEPVEARHVKNAA